MAVLDIRERTGWLFLAVTVGHIVLISAQVNTRRGVPLLEEVTFGAFAEVQRASTSVLAGAREGWQNYFALQQIRQESERLRQEVAALRIELQQERALAQQTRTLQELLALQRRLPADTSAAYITASNVIPSTVIGSGASTEFRTISIDKGTQDGIRADMAVIAPGGIVGRTVTASPRATKVQLLIDRAASAGGIIERSRAQGLVSGTADPQRLQMTYVSGAADVKVGDTVVTSGIEGIYPKGFVIGRIESVQRGSGDFEIAVRPAVTFADLEAVLVVRTAPAIDQAATAPANDQP